MANLNARRSPNGGAASRGMRLTAVTAAGLTLALIWVGASYLKDRAARSPAENAASEVQPASVGGGGPLSPSSGLGPQSAPGSPASGPVSLLGGDWRPLPTPITAESQPEEPVAPVTAVAQQPMIPFDPASPTDATVPAKRDQAPRSGAEQERMFEGAPYAGPLPKDLFK